MKTIKLLALVATVSCAEVDPNTSLISTTEASKVEETPVTPVETEQSKSVSTEVAAKLTAENCVDPDLSKVMKGNTLMLCDGSMAEGTMELLDVSQLKPENLKAGTKVADITGTYSGAVLPDLTQLKPENLKAGVQIASVIGTYDNRPSDCSNNGAWNCVATATYKAADISNVSATNIKSGVTIAGVLGTYNGAVAPADCTANGQVGCVTTSTYKSADLTNLVAANIKSGTAIAGVTGSYDNRPADCSANAQIGCVTTSTYKSADLTNLVAGNVKNGVNIAGVSGGYPSATYKLSGADSTADLTLATFDAKVKSATAFEWFDAEGNRYQNSGDADIVADNIKDGVTIFGATGALVQAGTPSAWDIRKGVTINGVTGSAAMNCRRRSGLAPESDKCYGEMYEDQTHLGFNNVNENGTTCASSPSTCRVKDRISGLLWARVSTTIANFTTATSNCAALNVDGITGWRLPDSDEMMRAYIQGIYHGAPDLFNGTNNGYRSQSAGNTGHLLVRLRDSGTVVESSDSIESYYFCVK